MKVFCATFPRSGSQFLADCVKETIGNKLKWCESYSDPFCPVCHNMVKTHDFDLADGPPNGWATVVQIRDPLHAVPSWFDVQVGKYGQVDTYEEWFKWATKSFLFWRKFVHRWCFQMKTDLIIGHDRLVQRPNDYVSHVAGLITGTTIETPVFAVRRPTSCLSFRYFNEDDFDYFKSLVVAEMKMMGMDQMR